MNGRRGKGLAGHRPGPAAADCCSTCSISIRPSGKEEDIQLYLEELLTRAGFIVERQEVEEDRYNLR